MPTFEYMYIRTTLTRFAQNVSSLSIIISNRIWKVLLLFDSPAIPYIKLFEKQHITYLLRKN